MAVWRVFFLRTKSCCIAPQSAATDFIRAKDFTAYNVKVLFPLNIPHQTWKQGSFEGEGVLFKCEIMLDNLRGVILDKDLSHCFHFP